MKREQLFSDTGYYRFLVESNVLLHRDAIDRVVAAMSEHFDRHRTRDSVNVLDLACGGLPVTIAQVMGRFPDRVFRYTGIDVNPDQVALARREFTFPPNVERTTLREGNAWDIRGLNLKPPFQVIFSGMNLHHGTPEEICFLGLQVRDLLSAGGIFISHDVFRPDGQLYRRRPDTNPDDPEESFQLVEWDKLQEANITPFSMRDDTAAEEPAWRVDYLQRMRRTLLARGGDPAGADETVQHMRQRDYPISSAEFRSIFEDLGFHVTVIPFAETGEPLGPYVALCIAEQASLHFSPGSREQTQDSCS